MAGQWASQGTSAKRPPTLDPAALAHPVLMLGHLPRTLTRRRKTYIACKWAGQKLSDEILQRAQGGYGPH